MSSENKKSFWRWPFGTEKTLPKVEKVKEIEILYVDSVARVDNNIEIRLSCPACQKHYDITDRLPKILPDCFHVFCKKCILNRLTVNFIETEEIFFHCFSCETVYRNIKTSELKTEHGSLIIEPLNFADLRRPSASEVGLQLANSSQ